MKIIKFSTKQGLLQEQKFALEKQGITTPDKSEAEVCSAEAQNLGSGERKQGSAHTATKKRPHELARHRDGNLAGLGASNRLENIL